jgi:hypothetical protein
MTTKNEMESFLRTLATYQTESGQAGLPALLLEKGSWFEGRADSDEYAVTKQWKKKRKPEAQDCFYNSQEFCAEVKGSRYFEGFVLVQTGLLPSEHCWVVMQDCRVVDFTLEALEVIVPDKGLTVDSRGALYVGLEVPRAIIVERLGETGWYEPIAELFYADHIKRIADGGQGPTTAPLGRKRPSK